MNINDEKNYISKLKLKALLHDPVHKIWSFGNVKREDILHKDVLDTNAKWHEKVAQDLFNFLISEDLKDNNIQIADAIASSLSRIVVAPNVEGDERKEFDEGSSVFLENAKYIDPFSGQIENIGCPNSHKEVKEIFEKLGKLNFDNQEERAKFFFLFLWRFLPDIFPWIEKHPADSRTPNHSIYDHLVQTSAIATCLQENDKPAFLIFTITPVQSFIATARKTSDLWAGSFLLSYLTYKAIEKIIEKLGPDHIIFPNLRCQPLLDVWLCENIFKDISIDAQVFKDWKDRIYSDGKFTEEFLKKLTIANIPNRFLAILPYNKAKDIAKECQETIEQTIDNLLSKIADEKIEKAKTDIKNHLLSYLKPYWVVLPFYKDSYRDIDSILEEYKNLVGENDLYETIQIIKSHQYYKPANVGAGYSLLVELAEKFLASRKMLKDFVVIKPQTGEKCHLCGEYDVLNLHWNSLSPKYVSKSERLCGICLFKRLLPEIIKNMYNLSDEIKYPSTSEMATVLYKKSLNENFVNNFINKLKEIFGNELPSAVSVPALKENKLYRIDGQWLMESSYRKSYLINEFGVDVDAKLNEMNEMREFLNKHKMKPPVYYAILAMDGDNMGKWLKGEFAPAIKDMIHSKVSETLRNYNDENLNQIFEKKHPMSPSIHNQFSRRLSEFALDRVREIVEDKYLGKLIYAGGDDVLAFLPVETAVDCAFDLNKAFREKIGEKATMSGGIVIVHHKYPLSLALDEVREAEKIAKNRYVKDAFCIKYLSGSGQERFSGLKWGDKENFFDKIIQKYKNDELSSRFAYDFMNVVRELLPQGTTGDSSISKLLKNELKRIYRHKLTKEKYDSTFEEDLINMFDKFSYSYEDFANLLIIARAIAKRD